MERRYVKEVDRLRTISHDGEVFTVVEYQRIFEFVQLDGASTLAKGLRVFRLDNGACVNYVDSETFKIVDTGQIIQRFQDIPPMQTELRVLRRDGA